MEQGTEKRVLSKAHQNRILDISRRSIRITVKDRQMVLIAGCALWSELSRIDCAYYRMCFVVRA